MSRSLPLAGKTAIVTGASSGIGRAIAEKLGGAGAHVYLAGRTLAAMEESKTQIERDGGRAAVVALDVRDLKQVLPDEAVEKLQAAMKQVLASADDVADAVLYAVTQPIRVNIAEIVVRPPKQLNL